MLFKNIFTIKVKEIKILNNYLKDKELKIKVQK